MLFIVVPSVGRWRCVGDGVERRQHGEVRIEPAAVAFGQEAAVGETAEPPGAQLAVFVGLVGGVHAAPAAGCGLALAARRSA
jgi:hypothetical protein